MTLMVLDFGREPPGYMVGAGGDFQDEGYVWWTERRHDTHYFTAEAALAGAWHDYMKRNDPPGCANGGARVNAWIWYRGQTEQ